MNISDRFGKIRRQALLGMAGMIGALTGQQALAGDPPRLPDYSEAPTPSDVMERREAELAQNFNDPAKPGTVYIRPLGDRFPMERYGLIMLGPSEDLRNYVEPTVSAEIYETHKDATRLIRNYAAHYADQDTYELAAGQPLPLSTPMSAEDLSTFVDAVGQLNSTKTPLFSRTRNYLTILRGLEHFPEGSGIRQALSYSVAQAADYDHQLFKKLSIENPTWTPGNIVSYTNAQVWRFKNHKLKGVRSARGDFYPVYGETRNDVLIQHDTQAAPYMLDTLSAAATAKLYAATANGLAPAQVRAPADALRQKTKEVAAQYNRNNDIGSLLQLMVLANISPEVREMVPPAQMRQAVNTDCYNTSKRVLEYCQYNERLDRLRQNQNTGKVLEEVIRLNEVIKINTGAGVGMNSTTPTAQPQHELPQPSKGLQRQMGKLYELAQADQADPQKPLNDYLQRQALKKKGQDNTFYMS